MKKLVCLWLLLVGCKAQLREPFCKSSLAKMPADIQGFYEVVIPQPSVEFSGNFILSSAFLAINDQTIQSSSQGLEAGGGFTAFCEVQGKYYIEQMNYNGTYAMTELVKFNQGLILSQQAIDLDKVVARKMKMHYVPDVDKPDDSSKSHSIGFGSGSFILDNTHMSPEDVLSVSKSISIQIILKSVSRKPGFKPARTYSLKKD